MAMFINIEPMPDDDAAASRCRAYLKTMVLALIALGVAMGGLMLAMDPYGVFATRLVPDHLFAPDRRLTFGGDRVIKAIVMQAQNPRTVVAGSSRVAIGFDPQSPALQGLDLYNAGLAGAAAPEILGSARYAAATVPALNRIVLCLEFDLFFQPLGEVSDFEDSAFAGRSLTFGKFRVTYALEAIATAFRKIPALIAGRPIAGTLSIRGWLIRMPQLRPVPLRSFFRQELATLGVTSLHKSARYLSDTETRYHDLHNTLRVLQQRGINVDIVLTPVHAWRLDLIQEFGLWPAYEMWKRRITTIVAAVSSDGAKSTLRLFDFNVVADMTSEAVAPDAGSQAVRYFHESSHFYPIVGDYVFKIMDGSEPVEPNTGFGRLLTPDILDAHMQLARHNLDDWRASHPDEVAVVVAALPKDQR
jgi:hypothetical protein